MSDTTLAKQPPVQAKRKFSLGTLALLLLPLLALGLVIVAFLQTGGGLTAEPPAPIEDLAFERTVLRPGQIELHARNTGPEALTIAQVIVNDAIWPMQIHPSPTVPRLGRATITLDYPWVRGEAYAIKFLTANAIAFTTDIPVAAATPEAEPRTFWGFTLIGLYVGVIPVYLGLLWFPALRPAGDHDWAAHLPGH
jgi:hypothetical protein